jgi:hypothetical protein
MKVNEMFLKAKKDKHLYSMLVFDRIETNSDEQRLRRKYIRLIINTKNKYTLTTDSTAVETDTEIVYEDYSFNNKISRGIQVSKCESLEVCFHCGYHYNYDSHIKTFLSLIKKDSDVKFRVLVCNSCDSWDKLNITNHMLYGYIDDKCFLLNSYVGEQNLASPVRW